jgi:hypothetical protein
MTEPSSNPLIHPRKEQATMHDHDISYAAPEFAGSAPSSSATTTPGAGAAGKPSGVKRVAASLLLAVGLLTVGGAAIVSAASPDPSATPTPAASSTPSTTTPGTPGTNATPDHANCPNM